MTATTVDEAPVAPIPVGREDGPASTRTVVGYGFWIFLLSDIIMFSGLFAAYAVLWQHVDGGPTGLELFDLRNVFIETACLLLSSYTCGLGALSAEHGLAGRFYLFEALTCTSARRFCLSRYPSLPAWRREKAYRPAAGAFLSAFFTLVGMHGAQRHQRLFMVIYGRPAAAAGLRLDSAACAGFCASAYSWHALDIIWVGVFTMVYSIGGR